MVTENPSTGMRTPNSIIRLALIGSLLTIVNTTVATVVLGVFQGFIVSFTTPFVFAIGRLLYPRKFSATILYTPVVIVSIFTLNFGPPGHYKIFFIFSAIIYDLVCYALGVSRQTGNVIPLWKLIIANIFYPIGLLLSALIIIKLFTVELPIISRGWIGAIMLLVFFGIMGSFATYIAHKVFQKWLYNNT